MRGNGRVSFEFVQPRGGGESVGFVPCDPLGRLGTYAGGPGGGGGGVYLLFLLVLVFWF